jgi:hypothetical protein
MPGRPQSHVAGGSQLGAPAGRGVPRVAHSSQFFVLLSRSREGGKGICSFRLRQGSSCGVISRVLRTNLAAGDRTQNNFRRSCIRSVALLCATHIREKPTFPTCDRAYGSMGTRLRADLWRAAPMWPPAHQSGRMHCAQYAQSCSPCLACWAIALQARPSSHGLIDTLPFGRQR